jgi:ribose transport system permease protein
MSEQVMAEKMAQKKNSKVVAMLSKPEVTVGLALIILCIVLTLVRPDTFLTVRNIFNILRQSSLIAILAVGMSMIIITGGIDLSVGSLIAISAAFGTSLHRTYGLSPILVLLAILLMGTACGTINGLLVSKAGIPPFIVTLGMLSIANGGALLITNGSPISYQPTWISVFGGGYVGPVPVSVMVMATIVLVGFVFLNNTLTGRNIYSIGNSLKAANLSGVPVDKTVTMAYSITGFFAGICGLLLIGQMNSADPSFGKGYELDVIAACVIGGISLSGGEGNVLGVVIGALLMGVLKNMFVLLAVSGYWQTIIIGSVIIGAVAIDSIRKKRASR